jgi:hypothetical protein
MVNQYKKVHFDVHPYITAPEELLQWLKDENIQVLNVAGNSERTSPGIYKFAYGFLAEVLNYEKEGRKGS